MNNGKWTAIAIGYMCGFAYLIALIVYQLGGLILGEVSFGLGTVAAVIALVFLLYMMFRKNKYNNDHLSISAVDAVGNR